jgi:hypothetical protein
MPNVRRLSIILAVVLLAASDVAAKDWRGLLPMHSTRADVINLLGLAPDPAPLDRLFYPLDDADVLFMFADKASLATGNCDAAVAEGTLLAISVRPKKETLPASLNLDESDLKRVKATESDSDWMGLIDEEQGILVGVVKQFVEEVVYVPSLRDRSRCAKYFNNVEEIIKPIPKIICVLAFDNYGDIRFSDEQARLDNFAIQIDHEPKNTGYIIVYAGRKALVAEAQLRANRARDYIVNVRHIDPARVKAVDGGYREDLTVYLYILPVGATPPVAEPSIDPKDVQIIYEKKRRPRSRDD